MSVAVLIQARIKPERISAVLAALHDRIGSSDARASTRSRERVFLRLGSNGDLLSMCQWPSTQERDVTSTTLTAEFVGDALAEPMKVHRLLRLLTFERPMQRVDITACALIVPTHGDSPAVRARVLGDRTELRNSPGLISHEIYVTSDLPTTYVSIHSWRHLTDLERFRAKGGALNEQRLAEVGATLERFTGAVVAEYPLVSASG